MSDPHENTDPALCAGQNQQRSVKMWFWSSDEHEHKLHEHDEVLLKVLIDHTVSCLQTPEECVRVCFLTM